MLRCRLPLKEALRYATEVAAALRDLHAQGLSHGAVSSEWIWLEHSAATLRAVGKAQHLGEVSADVVAFGKLLDEMVRGDDLEADGLAFFRDETLELAVRCRNESLSMRNVLINLRLLALRTRHHRRSLVGVTRQAAGWSKHAPRTRVVVPRVRARIYLSIRWKPLARLAFALLDK